MQVPIRCDAACRGLSRTTVGAARARDLPVAGDCVAIGGADAAELQGELAALSLREDLGIGTSAGRVRTLRRKLRRLQRFRVGLERAFPFPFKLVSDLPKETIACPLRGDYACGNRQGVIAELRPEEPSRLDVSCRAGMGRCQGRVCGMFLAEYGGMRYSRSVADIAPLRTPVTDQAPGFRKGRPRRRARACFAGITPLIETRILVIGGGIVGVSAALHLARRSAKVVLLEKGMVGAQASGVNFGGLRTNGREAAEIPLSLRARTFWGQIREHGRATIARWSLPGTSR